MSKAKVVLKETGANEEGLSFVSKDKGDIGICLSMCLGYVARLIIEGAVSNKQATQLLKDMIKEEKNRRGEGTWL